MLSHKSLHALASTNPNILFGFTKMLQWIGKTQRWGSCSHVEFYFVCARRGFKFFIFLVFRPNGVWLSFASLKETHTYKSKEKGTPSRFLIQPINHFLNAPVHTHIHVLNELTANVLFAVAESYSLLGKAQRWEVVAVLSYSSSLFVVAVTRSHALRWNTYFLRKHWC